MRIGIVGWGSEGDLRPLIALGARLRKNGHEVRLILSPVDAMDYAPVCRSLDLGLQVVPEKMANSLTEICQASKSADPSKASRALLDQCFFPYQEAMYQAALGLCGKSDVVVALGYSSYAKAACLKTGVPFVAVHYYPGLVRSKVLPPIGFPAWRWLNPIAWFLMTALLDLAFKKPAAKFFAEKGLPKIRHALEDAQLSDRLNLLAASPTLFPPAPDWTELNSVCGEFVMPDDQAWEPSAPLREFLEGGGAKPILVSFGTLEHLAPERARDLIVAAVKQAKVRAVVQTKAKGEEGRDGDIYFLRWAPHAKLLPRCAAMVLHGGAGTTHAAMRAGVPAVVVPFIFEQGLWGGLLHKAGSATKPVSFWKTTPDKLAAQIVEATTSEKLRTRARELARAAATEDGTGTATRLLEKVMARPS